MTTRYSLKLGVGLMSLMAVAAGAAQARASGEEEAYELALASQAATATAAAAATPVAPAAKGRVSTTVGGKVGPDGLVEGGAYIEADVIGTIDIRDSRGKKIGNDGIMRAYGNVLMRYKGNIIRADEVEYNTQTHTTTGQRPRPDHQ
ncbi:MAG: hypothetical protein WDN06_19215 [Asticcacaulis sp.]